MKSTILVFDTQKQINHMIECLNESKLAYREQKNLVSELSDLEVYHNTIEDINELKKTYFDKLQTKIF